MDYVRTPTRATGGITPQEKIALDAHTQKWIANALSTEPVAPERLVPAIKALYAAAELKEPRVVIVPSPLVMALAGGFAAAIWHIRKTGAAATYDVADATTRVATDVATVVATVAATVAATSAATDSATRDVTIAATDAIFDATRDATYAATVAATYAATDSATRAATSAATSAAPVAATGAATSAATDAATRAATYAATSAAIDAATSAAIDAATLGTTNFFLACAQNWYRMYQGGNMWSAYDCYLTAMRDVIGLRLPEHEKYAAWEACAKEGGFRIMHEEFCMVSDRPELLTIDEQNRPHNAVGPSHRWRDGWSLYYWHGVRIPYERRHIIEAPSTITVAEIEAETNAEVRRVMIERYGADRYVRDSGAMIMHSVPDDHPLIGLRGAKLYRKNVPDDESIYCVDVANSTPEPDGSIKRYMLRVDPNAYGGRAAQDCIAAIASTWRMEDGSMVFAHPEDYCPHIET